MAGLMKALFVYTMPALFLASQMHFLLTKLVGGQERCTLNRLKRVSLAANVSYLNKPKINQRGNMCALQTLSYSRYKWLENANVEHVL